MDAIDYGSRLTKKHNEYQDRYNDLRDTYNENLEELEENQELRLASQKKSYDKDRAKTEREIQDYVEVSDVNTREAIEGNAKIYRESLKEQREEVQKEIDRDRTDTARRLGELKESFQKVNESNERYHLQKQASTTDRYDKQKKQNQLDFDQGVKAYNEKISNELESTKAAYDTEKRQILHKSNLDKKELTSEGSIAKNKLNTDHQKEIESLRSVQNERLLRSKSHQEGIVENIKKLKNEEKKNVASNYREMSAESDRRNNQAFKKLNIENRDVLKNKDRAFAKEKQQLTRRYTETLKGGTLIDQANDKVRSANESARNRVSILKNQLSDQQMKFQEDKDLIIDSYTQEMDQQNRSNNEKMDKRETQVRELNTKILSRAKGKSDKAIESYKRELASEVYNNQKNQVEARNNLNQGMSAQRENFSHTVNEINEKNQKAISQLQEGYAKEKTEYIENMRKTLFQSREDLKDELGERYSKNEESYDKRLENLSRANKRLREVSELKLSNLEKKFKKEKELQNKIEESRREEDKRSAKREAKTKEREMMKQMLNLRKEFDRRITKAKSSSDIRVSKLTQRYEDMMSQMRGEFKSEMNLKVKELESAYHKLYESGEIEKDAIRHQSELRIEKLRQALLEAKAISSKRG